MKKGILLILDGYGEGKDDPYNAVKNANTPFLHSLKEYPHSLIDTSGESVGIFKGELGGSEVGHMTLGSSKIIPSTVKHIRDDIKSGKFRQNKKLLAALKGLKEGANIHLIGMMSDKNVHSNINHAYEIIEAAEGKAKNIYLHLFTDGRDTAPFDSLKYIKKVKTKIKNYKNCEISSIGGRVYGMDREDNLDRTKLAMDSMFNAKESIKPTEIESYLKNQHQIGNTDQFIKPVHIITKTDDKLKPADLVIMFNFREDRVRQLAKMFNDNYKNKLVTMSDVAVAKSIVLYPSPSAKHTFSEHLSKHNLRQIKISETTKYAHVTYFFNGGHEEPFPLEDRVHIISHKVDIFSKTPKMRAKEITDEVLKAIDKSYDAIIVNYSNPDMLGHTGNYEATVQSLEFMDKCIKKVVDYAKKHNYFLIITADHGNAETMRTENGEPHMAHTLNPVICAVVDDKKYKMKKRGGLYDVAPTFLDLMGENPCPHFEGHSLIVR